MQIKFFLFFVNTLKLLLLHLNIPTLDKLLTQIIVFFDFMVKNRLKGEINMVELIALIDFTLLGVSPKY